MEVLPETKLFRMRFLSYDVKIMCMFENMNVFYKLRLCTIEILCF